MSNSFGILTKTGDVTYAEALAQWEATDQKLTATKRGGGSLILNFDQPASVDPATGRLNFTASGVEYLVREPREDDGQWLSANKTLLPLRALQALITGETVAENLNNPDDQVVAFSLDDSAYILGVVYTNAAGRWGRLGGDWRMLAPTDTTFDGMIATPIDPARADDFIALYDENYVTTSDAEEYEVASPVSA